MSSIRLPENPFTLARYSLAAIALVAMCLAILGIPARYHQLQIVIPPGSAGQDPLRLFAGDVPALRQLNLTPAFYAAYFTIVESLFFVSFAAIGTLLFSRREQNWMILFSAFTFLLTGAVITPFLESLVAAQPAWRLPAAILYGIDKGCLLAFFYLFPNGRPFPRWSLLWTAGLAIWAGFTGFLPPGPLNSYTWSLPVEALVSIGILASGALAQIYRYRHLSTPIERQQTHWVVLGISISLFLYIAGSLIYLLFDTGAPTSKLLASFIIAPIFALALLLVPVTITVSILRFRLWEIDRLINRALVYGFLSAFVVGVYVFVVGFSGELLHPRGELHQPFDFAFSLLATAGIAVLFQPARQRLQNFVNHLMYGERDNPHAVLARLGGRLEAALTPDAMLPMVVETIAQALKLPYANISLWQEGKYRLAAEYGRMSPFIMNRAGEEGEPGSPPQGVLDLPLVFQSEELGRLILAPRAAGEAFTPADIRFLEEVASQAGAVVYTVKLLTELQRSRERLVMTREEERRRLRRDLHDGLGSALASLSFNLDAARNLLSQDPAATDALLADLKTQTQAAIADIRHLIYDLRPPALDELGLVPALQQYIDRVNRPAGLSISIHAPDALPTLPAAVEVAAYRIVLEALTNVIRHANAKHCMICLSIPVPARLAIEIEDDGQGLAMDGPPGIGTSTMRERSDELGGSLLIEENQSGGTRVAVNLPLSKPV